MDIGKGGRLDHAICPVKPVDDAKTAVGCGRGAPVMREMRGEKALLIGKTMN
jgi:hypothetical protein